MEYSFWQTRQGGTPVLDDLQAVAQADANSGKSYWLQLSKVEKYTYQQLIRKLLKKLKGKNPYKLFELRFALPRKIARTFCVISRDSKLWLLHLVIKKKDGTKRSDIKIAEERAKILEQTIHYL
ncbi:TPA: hypothetical protein DIV48_02215 [Candidatus Kaiserbacteria bacterium]|nr:MAG: hypothetical protein UY93_C0001G0040 [Parcubacteria group bacterium GW2011_GWA1_56_13]KKW46978.1 MAG: hypothetical protein UY97_C0001G0035 [Parcubacteria group bacterium GW2011_GWB1_57_6]HCR52442.1 hypothetical protein [Candidatus Kaiserbacteria bacterium]